LRVSCQGDPMYTIKKEKKIAVLNALMEGCSIRSIVRMTDVHKTTILKLLVKTGEKCHQILDQKIKDIRCEAIECDELWSFIGKKQKKVTPEELKANPYLGDAYTFIGFEPESKAILNFEIGKRDFATTDRFVYGLKKRISGRVQISTDGFVHYCSAIERHFGSEVDYAQIVKLYGNENPDSGRYSPPQVTGVNIRKMAGRPKYNKICTSFVERNNWTIRTHQRRLTRLSNGFSRKFENLKASLSIYFWWYNFCKIHGSLRVSPAMALGVSNRLWTLEELITP